MNIEPITNSQYNYIQDIKYQSIEKSQDKTDDKLDYNEHKHDKIQPSEIKIERDMELNLNIYKYIEGYVTLYQYPTDELIKMRNYILKQSI